MWFATPVHAHILRLVRVTVQSKVARWLTSRSQRPLVILTLSVVPSECPTLSECGITSEQCQVCIMQIFDILADPDLIQDPSTPQGKPTKWIIGQDVHCPMQ